MKSTHSISFRASFNVRVLLLIKAARVSSEGMVVKAERVLETAPPKGGSGGGQLPTCDGGYFMFRCPGDLLSTFNLTKNHKRQKISKI